MIFTGGGIISRRIERWVFCAILVCAVFALLSYLQVPSSARKQRHSFSRASHPFAATVDAVTPGLLSRFSIPGAAVALIRNGEVVWMSGYGFADIATAKPVTPETGFNVGSISKTPAAWAVMHLVEEGKVDLDRPIEFYLKRWRLPTASFDNRQVTVRRLLSHTSGISTHDYHGWDPDKPLPPIEDSLSGKTGTGEVHVVSTPGSAFSYSGANFLILASMGYQLMRRGDVLAAVEIFRLNVEEFPRDWNVYDSLGEAYLKLGDKPRAIESYKRSLELNSHNDNGRQMLKTLGVTIQ